jgi:hypothetical protein
MVEAHKEEEYCKCETRDYDDVNNQFCYCKKHWCIPDICKYKPYAYICCSP